MRKESEGLGRQRTGSLELRVPNEMRMLRVGCFGDWTAGSTAEARLLESGSELAGSGKTSRNGGQQTKCATFWDRISLTLRAKEPADESWSSVRLCAGVEKSKADQKNPDQSRGRELSGPERGVDLQPGS